MPASCSSSVAEIAARALPARDHITLVGDHILNWLAVGNYRAVVGQAVFANNIVSNFSLDRLCGNRR